MQPWLKLIRWAGTKRWFTLIGRHVLTPIDKALHKRGHSATAWATGLPLGFLTTTGRRSGKPRTSPLLYLVTAADAAAIVGTNFGGAGHPHWVANLLENPRAGWKVDREVPVLARKATAEEYSHLWPRFVALWPGYENYVARSQRIPLMFILETI